MAIGAWDMFSVPPHRTTFDLPKMIDSAPRTTVSNPDPMHRICNRI